MNTVLHADRLEGRGAHQRKRTYWAQMAKLPDGAFIHLDGSAWLLWPDQLLEWPGGGYRRRRPPLPASSPVEVLTPLSLAMVLRSGYPREAQVSANGHG
jgi:hypothetical protein